MTILTNHVNLTKSAVLLLHHQPLLAPVLQHLLYAVASHTGTFDSDTLLCCLFEAKKHIQT